jgi:uncharacterized phiE125 gp8 family phage protein
MALDTLDNVKLHLGVIGTTDDALLNQVRTAADAFVEQFCGRAFTGGSFTEDHPGGSRVLFLRNYPISSVTSVKADPDRAFGAETTIDPSRYLVHADRGLIESLWGPFIPPRPGWVVRAADFPGAVRVAYSTPTDQVPQPVMRAYAELVGHWYRQAKTFATTGQVNYVTQTNGSVVTTYPWAHSTGYRVPEGVLQLLRSYRVPPV